MACWWIAMVVSAPSLAGVALSATDPKQFADGFGVPQIVVGWAFLAGPFALAAMGLGNLGRREMGE